MLSKIGHATLVLSTGDGIFLKDLSSKDEHGVPGAGDLSSQALDVPQPQGRRGTNIKNK